MAEHPVFKIVPSPTNSNWRVEREGEDQPLVIVDSKEDAVRLAKHMAKEHDGKVAVSKGKGKAKKTTKKAA